MSIKRLVAPIDGEVDRWRERVCQETNKKIFEADTTAAGAGTDGTISSRSAAALGECDGFLKMYLTNGTEVYVPYWLDITPS